MGCIWRRIGVYTSLVIGLLDASYGYPVGDIEGNYDRNWLTLWPCLLSAVVLFAVTAALGCCLCCRHNQNGFKEFTDSGSSHSLSTGGYTNPAAASSPSNEFAIFPPPPLSGSYSGGLISFEPLPDITSGATQQHCLKPAAFNTHAVSAQDWFDDPHANYPRNQLKYICEFGKGWFGRVVEGETFDLSNGKSKRVVVKILHGDATPTDQMYFLHEVRYLRDLTPHPNILALLGWCLETDPFLIILEGSPNGDLKTYLLRNAEALRGQGVHIRMASNIAQGLQFMHEKGFVHTDLAARNCVIDGNLMVKIGDYGTSTENFKDEYYWASDFALPIRWCAPETLHCTESAIITKEVTASANIWSFAILLWEICEFGKLPFSDLNDEEVIVKVHGERSCLPGQPTCLQASNLYHLMHLCWRADDKWRPCASQVAAVLDYLHKHPNEETCNSLGDFENQWMSTRDDDKISMVESNAYIPLQDSQQKYLGNDKCTDELPIKIKSPSLQNLHGSLEDLSFDKMHLMLERKCWLHNEMVHEDRGDDDDAQFVQKISEVIRDLDDVLALEKTSSSGSPDECSPKKRLLQESHDKIDENGVLDFRLDEGKEVFNCVVDGNQRITINSTNECNISGKAINSSSSGEVETDMCKELESQRGENWRNENMKSDDDEEEDDLLQRVERGEFSAKVKDKWRSVQDLMVLTHIEESSEGSDSETCNNKSSPAPIHPSGSVGDLRSVVLDEELRHTLERFINKRRDTPSEDLNSLEKFDKNREVFEVPKRFDDIFSSSQLNENVICPLNITGLDEQSSDGPEASLYCTAQENLSVKDSDIVESKQVMCTDSNECSTVSTNSGGNFRIQSSTPLLGINSCIESPSKDSFDFIPLDLNKSFIDDRKVTMSPNFESPTCGRIVSEGTSSEVNSFGGSPSISGSSNAKNIHDEYLYDGTNNPHVFDTFKAIRNETDYNLEEEKEIPPLSENSDPNPSTMENVSNLKTCVSPTLPLANDEINCLDVNISSEFIRGKSEGSLQEEKRLELLNSESHCLQESPVSGEEEGNVGLSCGISGSQSTVECASPLALSPITVDCSQMDEAPVISSPLCELEKLKCDSITKEIDTDFIFSADAVMKNKNALIQPDFILSTKLDVGSDSSSKSVPDPKQIEANVVAEKKEVDVSCGNSTDKDFESSPLMLDLVPITSNRSQELFSEAPSFVVAASSDMNAEREDVLQRDADKFIDKECIQSDAPISEECDSAEDSVFDFSPIERKGDEEKKQEATRGEEDGLLNLKQWTPDDERSSDSGFREKGSLSESIEDERCELEIGAEEDIEGKEVTLSSDSCNNLDEKACADGNEHSDVLCVDKHSISSEALPEKGKCEEFWKWQLSSLRQAVGETASLLREASSDGWIKGEDWEDRSSSRDESRELDEASLAALRSELEEKLGASNGRFALEQEIERANSEEQLSDEECEERTDITIHYDAYLAQLSPILEERESVGSSALCSPVGKEMLGNSISENSATTASVNDLTDNQVFMPKDPADVVVEDILILDTETNKSSLVAVSPIDYHENDATSPEFTDSLEEDDIDKTGKQVGNPGMNSLQEHCEKDEYLPQPANSSINNTFPCWSLQAKPLKGLPLLVPPPVSSAPMPSPEEEKATCVDRAAANKAPVFRDFEDIVALCKGDERGDVQPFWESESSDGNDSSSSGEFVWKEGERDIAIGSDSVQQVPLVYESEFAMAVIEEEDEETDNDSVQEFIPSAWNCSAEPSRSSLRSPDRKSDQKKNVSFKRQKYQCVYEYPKEEGSDSDGEAPSKQIHTPLDYSTYADWELMEGDIPAETGGDADLDISEEANNLPTQAPFDFYKLSSEDFDFGFEGDFMVSSSSRPFEYCSEVGLPPPLWSSDPPPGVPDLLMDTMSKCHKEKKEELSPCESPPNSQCLGELRHTRDRLKLDLNHKVSEGKVQRREEERGEASVLDVDKETKTAL